MLQGTIHEQPALLLIERAPFPVDQAYLGALPGSLAQVRSLGANDVYSWHMARAGAVAVAGTGSSSALSSSDHSEGDGGFFADLKINLIFPCTETHVNKYSPQAFRFVTETPAVYATRVRPYMERKRGNGRLNWVYNIIEGRAEAEDVLFRTPLGQAGKDGEDGFLLLPDLNWDRTTVGELRLLAVVERRDIWSIRDLRKSHVPWLRHMQNAILNAVTMRYPPLERDQIKLYFHYQPSYYHLHVHVVNVAAEANATQATGKAIGLESVIELLEAMDPAVGEEKGMEAVSLSYSIGEAHELWTEVFAPLKLGDKKEDKKEEVTEGEA